ncbi:MAG TPA: hypothetical protein VI916_06020 [Acidimicrobiia bacterium]|nr:hypothetical protein [Acidimicrobiia bacterium]
MRAHREPVEVRSSFEHGHWSSGFEVAEVVRRQEQEFVRIRRRSDGAILPTLFSPEDVRRARR